MMNEVLETAKENFNFKAQSNQLALFNNGIIEKQPTKILFHFNHIITNFDRSEPFNFC